MKANLNSRWDELEFEWMASHSKDSVIQYALLLMDAPISTRVRALSSFSAKWQLSAS